MNSSLSGLSTALAAPVALSGGGSNSELLQSDSSSSQGFLGVFGDVISGASPELPEAVAMLPDGEALLAGLQALPQGGKLLPLLQKTLDSVAGSGIDMEQFVKRLTAGLQELARAGDAVSAEPPAEQLAFALQQLVQEQPALRSVLPAEISSALERGAGLADKLANDQALRNLSVSLAQHTRDNTADNNSQSVPQAADGKPFTLDPMALPQPVSANTQVPENTNMMALLAAIKRLSPDTPGATSADAPPVTASAPSATATAAPAPASVAQAVTVNTPFEAADWDQALGERIQWLASQKVQGAQVKLNPANLGPIEVRIQMQNDQASVQFSAHHAVVREALEAALPRLRDMFEASGVQLVDVDVSGQSSTGHRRAMQDTVVPPHGPGGMDAELTAESGNQMPLAAFMASGRLDLFA